MTKRSRNRRKAIRRWIRMGLITMTHYPGGRVKMPFNKALIKRRIKLVKQS